MHLFMRPCTEFPTIFTIYKRLFNNNYDSDGVFSVHCTAVHLNIVYTCSVFSVQVAVIYSNSNIAHYASSSASSFTWNKFYILTFCCVCAFHNMDRFACNVIGYLWFQFGQQFIFRLKNLLSFLWNSEFGQNLPSTIDHELKDKCKYFADHRILTFCIWNSYCFIIKHHWT